MTDRSPADQQIRELAETVLNRNILLSAGAGAGKTRVLVNRYINSLTLTDVRVSEVVAVTFTEKAAAEMKTRVRQACRERLRKAREGNDPEQTGHWLRHLRDLEHAPVSTIHSLCASILREFPLQAGLDPGFAVLTEEESPLLLIRSVHDSARRSLDGSESDLMSSLSILWNYTAATQNISKWVDQRELWSTYLEKLPRDREGFLEQWWEEVVRIVARIFEDIVFTSAIDSLAGYDPERFPGEDLLTGPAAKAVASARDIQGVLEPRNRSLIDMIARFGCLEKPGNKGRKANWDACGIDVEELKGLMSTAITIARDVFGGKHESWSEAGEESTAWHSWAFTQELLKAAARYEERKKRMFALDFTDLLTRTRDLLRDNKGVRCLVSSRCKYLMIDEFQDTNDVQKELLWYIAGASPLEGEERFEKVPRGAPLFVVGDVKQSIYRFRYADVSVFTRTRDEFEKDHDHCLVLDLTTNFRSRPELIDDLYNPLFSHPKLMGISEEDDNEIAHFYRANYTPLTSFREEGSVTDPVTLDVVVVPKSGVAGEDVGDDTNEDTEAPEPEPTFDMREARFREAELVARKIKELVEGHAIVCEKRGDSLRDVEVRWKHVALLFRAMGDVPIYESALRANGIDYYTLGGKGYYDRNECRDLVSFLRYLTNREDEVALIAVLRSPFCGLSDETLFWLARKRKLQLAISESWNEENGHQIERPPSGPLANIDALDWERLSKFMSTIAVLRQGMHRLSVSELLEEILKCTGYTAAVLAIHDGKQQLANVRKLIDIARRFDGGTVASSPEIFTEYLTQLMEHAEAEPLAPTQGEEENVVTISTIHRAKGLEWPVVFCPDLGRSRKPMYEPIHWREDFGFVLPGLSGGGEDKCTSILEIQPRKEERIQDDYERIRLLYVAMTRARDGLHMSGSVELTSKGIPKNNGSWLYKIIAETLEGEMCTELDAVPEVRDCVLRGGEVNVIEIGCGKKGENLPSSRPDSAQKPPEETSPRIPSITYRRMVVPPGRVRLQWWDPYRVERELVGEPKVSDLDGQWGELITGTVEEASWPEELGRRLGPVASAPSVTEEYVTGLATYLRCPRQYELSVRERLPGYVRIKAERQGEPSARQRGILLHRIVERLAYTPDAAVRSLAAACAREMGPTLARNRDLIDTAVKAIDRFKASELFAQLSEASQIMTEKELTVKIGEAYVTGVLDLLFRRRNGDWILIDYKTGAVEESHEFYVFQLGLYAAMAQRTFPGEKLATAGFYVLDRNEFVQISLPADVEDAERSTREALRGIVEGVFSPSGEASCPSCAHRWVCPDLT
jgi:ATP-dependent helicase/nuclease subunit A